VIEDLRVFGAVRAETAAVNLQRYTESLSSVRAARATLRRFDASSLDFSGAATNREGARNPVKEPSQKVVVESRTSR
jgi:hypothetical protein